MTHCSCPRDGSRLCDRCRSLLARATGREGPLLTPVTPRAVLEAQVPPEAPEGTLQDRLRTLARETGWLLYHVFNAKRSEPGFPDCTLVRADGPGPLYFLELKDATGRPSGAQQRWLAALARVTHVEAHVVRPGDWPWCVTRLTHP